MTEPKLDIQMDTAELDRLQAALEAAPDQARNALTAAAWEAGLLLQREISERTPRGVGGAGGLAGSIFARDPELSPDGLEISVAVGTSLPYAQPVEFGSKPHWPPLLPLLDWVTGKLGKSGDEALAMARGVQIKIARKGTQGAHMFRDAMAATESQVREIFQRAGKDFTAGLEKAAVPQPGAAEGGEA
jgi:hypothetical protein